MDLSGNTVFKDEEEKELWEAINDLSLKNREVLVLHYFSDMKLDEISESLGIPLGTCKSRLNSALDALRRRFPKNEFYFLNEKGEGNEII